MYTKNRVWQAGDVPTAAHFNNLEDGVFAADGGRLCFLPTSYDTATGVYSFDTAGRFSLFDRELFRFSVGDVNVKPAMFNIDSYLARPVYGFFQGAYWSLPGGRLLPGRIYSAVYISEENCFLIKSDGTYRVEYSGQIIGPASSEIFVSGVSGRRFCLAENSAVAYSGIAVAQRCSGDVAGAWRLSGAARRGTGDIALAGVPSATFVCGDTAASAYGVTVSVNTGAQALSFLACGDTTTDVRWRLCLDCIETRL